MIEVNRFLDEIEIGCWHCSYRKVNVSDLPTKCCDSTYSGREYKAVDPYVQVEDITPTNGESGEVWKRRFSIDIQVRRKFRNSFKERRSNPL